MIISLLLSLTNLTLPYNGKLLLLGTAASTNIEKPENLFWNPAGMGRNSYIVSAFNYSEVIFGSFGKIWELKSSNLGLGLQLMRSENMVKKDSTGNPIGTFNYQFAVPLIAGNIETNKFFIGAKVIFPYTTVDEYRSYGLGSDLGVIYSLNEMLSFSSYLRNFGKEIKPFLSKKENFPTELRLGGLLKKYEASFSLEYSFIFGICSSFSYGFNEIIGFTAGYNSKTASFNSIKNSILDGFSFGIDIKYQNMNISAGALTSVPLGISETISISFIP